MQWRVSFTFILHVIVPPNGCYFGAINQIPTASAILRSLQRDGGSRGGGRRRVAQQQDNMCPLALGWLAADGAGAAIEHEKVAAVGERWLL